MTTYSVMDKGCPVCGEELSQLWSSKYCRACENPDETKEYAYSILDEAWLDTNTKFAEKFGLPKGSSLYLFKHRQDAEGLLAVLTDYVLILVDVTYEKNIMWSSNDAAFYHTTHRILPFNVLK